MPSSNMSVILTGSSLGDRHRDFNLMVDRVSQNSTFKDFESWPEISPIDRIFKIDLASKHRNIDYILQNLKDSDMLYVSRSLKCLWLLEPQYCTVMNPDYLEHSLYPDMIQPAIHKIKHWLQINLKETEQCEKFYQYYKNDFNESIKFLWHCSSEFILSEMPNIIEKISYKQLNLLLEICPQAGKLYFEILPSSPAAISSYLKDEYNYFICIKHLLKWDGELFLDIIEKYFNTSKFNPFGPSLTKNIMRKYKNRVIVKCELYVSSVLHVNTLAIHLTGEEAKQVVLRLAQAEYLKHWFSYQKVEPLIKRLMAKDRPEFKKLIFNDKSATRKIEEWPYPLPSPLHLEDESDNVIFDDISDEPYLYGTVCNNGFKRLVKKKKCNWNQDYIQCSSAGQSPLDILFNRYRVIGFERTFYELSKNLRSESSNQGRLNIMLVLVSKTGGVPEQVEKLLKLLVERYKNEPTTLRAAVIRSLMKRCCAWRLPEDIWTLILEFGRDVGLDGLNTTPLCREGLHVVIIRHLLAESPMSSILVSGFMREFSDLSQYKLCASERKIIAHRLPLLILPLNPNAFLDCLAVYKKGIEDFPEAKTILFKAAKEDSGLLQRLYNSKILRRELFHETFCLNQSDEAYLNVLRHDVAFLENGQKFALLVAERRPKRYRFLRSLNLYFSEANGLAEKHRKALEEAFERNPKPWLAKPLCSLMSDQALLLHISALESKERPLTLDQFQSFHDFRANAHTTKPSLDIMNFVEWKWIGAKAIYNKALVCRLKDRDNYLKKLLLWSRTARISLRLSSNTPAAVNTFVEVCSLRPSAALKVALSLYFTKTYIDPVIWNALKPVIENKCTSKNKLLEKLSDLDSVPVNIEADYWVFIYKIVIKFNKNEAMPILCRLDNMLHKVDPNFCTEIIKEYIKRINVIELTRDKDRTKRLYIRIIAKYLLLYPDDTENICASFFNAIEVPYNEIEDKNEVLNYMNDFIFALKYSKAFLNQEYSSLIKVFDGILKRLQDFFPVEQFFGMYVDIHLTMLYLKAINQAMKKCNDVFEDSKQLKVVKLVGRLFGNYIGYEIKEVVARYFSSIIDLYKIRLNEYLREYFIFNKGRSYLVTFVIKGLIDVGTMESLILAEHLTEKEHTYHIPEPYKEEIIKVLKESENVEMKYFFYAGIV